MQILFHILHLHFCKCAEVVLIRTLSVPLRIQTGRAGFELFKMCFEQLPDDFFQFILSLPFIPLIFSSLITHSLFMFLPLTPREVWLLLFFLILIMKAQLLQVH